MAVAIAATSWPDTAKADPRDEIDYVLDFSGLLELGEEIDDYTLELPVEATALGFEIMEGGGRDHVLLIGTEAEDLGLADNVAVLVWLTIDVAYRGNAAFNVAGGASLPVEATVVTNSVPARTRQRTALLKVVQQ